MNDDLNLIVTFYSTSKEMSKIVLKVEHGMNLDGWKDWRFFRIPDIEKLILDAMPLHARSFCERILDIEDVFEVHEVKVEGKDTKEVKQITHPTTHPMVELSNGDIVQFMAMSTEDREVWRVFNDHEKKYLHLRESGIWATIAGDVLPGITIKRKIK